VPQKVTIYSNGAPVYTTPANTGIAAAPTDIGTFPVYLRYESQTMTGTNPDGSKYSDPGIPWVSYFSRGDALHGFVRGSYGWPQSVGCVELPPANAKIVYPLTPIGTLVTVS
jgi:lipoprotein-anchoring transpeptidase ErfK/SrfK